MPHANEESPLLDIEHPIAFDRIVPEDIEPAIGVLLQQAEADLRALESSEEPCTYDNTLGALERMTLRLGRAMGVVGHLESVATTPALRQAYNAVQPKVSAYYSSIPLSAGLWARLQRLAASDEAAALDPTRARYLRKTIEEFEREGAALGDADKARLQALNVELSEVTTRFAQNVLDSTNDFQLVVEDESRLAGLPQRAIDAARHDAEQRNLSGYRFSLQEPSLMPVLTYLDDGELREQVYRAYYARASEGERDNRPLLSRILALRAEKAKLLGFDNFVDLVLSDRMAGTGERARTFLDDLAERSTRAFEAERLDLTRFASEQRGGAPTEVRAWDVGYYAEKQRVARYDFDEEALRPYFPLEGVLDGLFELVRRLYGIEVVRANGIPVWHESVRTYRITDADGSELGVFYADLFPREQKRGGAWMNAFITGEPSDGTWSPHVGLMCANVTPPVGAGPSLLGHREVETIFHEFGHLMHHMLSRVSVRGLAGTNVAWDFVELPSQIMENWCWERESLDIFARHHESGEPIPDALFEPMRRARAYRGASAMMRQLGFGVVDLELHMRYREDRDGDLIAYSREVLGRFAPAPLPPDHAMVASFGHLFAHPVGYAGGYYSYKWAEVLDADAFTRFKQAGLFSREVGSEFRQKILARGDSRDPMDLFRDFMGREPDIAPLLERAGIREAAAE